MLKALVLCQRRGHLIDGNELDPHLENTRITIEHVIYRTLELEEDIPIDVEYMREPDNINDMVDIPFHLQYTESHEHNRLIDEFLRQNQETYDIIVLNTCPVMFMTDDNKPIPPRTIYLIRQLLKQNGLLIITAINGNIISNYPLNKPMNQLFLRNLFLFGFVNPDNTNPNIFIKQGDIDASVSFGGRKKKRNNLKKTLKIRNSKKNKKRNRKNKSYKY